MVVIILAHVAAILAAFGMAGRGEWSPGISNIFSTIWLALVVLFFIQSGIFNGFLGLMSTFAIGSISIRIFEKLLNA